MLVGDRAPLIFTLAPPDVFIDKSIKAGGERSRRAEKKRPISLLKVHGRGVVLLDLLLVAIVLGILGLVALPPISSFLADNKLNASATEIVSGLQYAANLAVRYQRPFSVKGDVATNRFGVYDTIPQPNPVPPAQPDNDPPVNQDAVVLNPFDKTWYIKDFEVMEVYKGVKIVSAPVEIKFYPDGHSGASDSSFIIVLSDKQKTITVDGITGRITVQ